MSELQQRVEKDFITAYKAKEELRVSVLRMLKAELKKKAVDTQKELTDDDVMATIMSQLKQRQDSVEQFTAAGRDDLASKEAEEMVILKEYMPAQLSDDELAEAIAAVIVELSAEGMKDMGKVMKLLGEKYKGQYDGKIASDIVKQKLSA